MTRRSDDELTCAELLEAHLGQNQSLGARIPMPRKADRMFDGLLLNANNKTWPPPKKGFLVLSCHV